MHKGRIILSQPDNPTGKDALCFSHWVPVAWRFCGRRAGSGSPVFTRCRMQTHHSVDAMAGPGAASALLPLNLADVTAKELACLLVAAVAAAD